MKLTDEQYRLAADAGYKATGWAYSCDKMTKETHRKYLEVAADHLQKPLEPPTDEEALKVSGGSYKDALERFVQLRNAPPVPVNKRQEILLNKLQYFFYGSTSLKKEAADAILAALDGEKEPKC